MKNVSKYHLLILLPIIYLVNILIIQNPTLVDVGVLSTLSIPFLNFQLKTIINDILDVKKSQLTEGSHRAMVDKELINIRKDLAADLVNMKDDLSVLKLGNSTSFKNAFKGRT